MNGAVLLALYGLCAWGAGLNSFAWSRLLAKGLREPRKHRWHTEPRLLVRVGLTLLSIGVAGASGTRFFDTLVDGAPLSLPPVGVAALSLMAMAEPLFLRVDEIHARELGKRSISWRLYWSGALVGGGMIGVASYMGVMA